MTNLDKAEVLLHMWFCKEITGKVVKSELLELNYIVNLSLLNLLLLSADFIKWVSKNEQNKENLNDNMTTKKEILMLFYKWVNQHPELNVNAQKPQKMTATKIERYLMRLILCEKQNVN